MKFIVHVTREHIERGMPQCPSKCPIALAIFDATGIKADVLGDVAFLEIPPDTPGHPFGSRRAVHLPIEVLSFVSWFDINKGRAGKPSPYFGGPFSFILDTEAVAMDWVRI